MTLKASPSRKMCSPSRKGPTCSTSTCKSRKCALSKPLDRQADEKAHVVQKWNSSPSSAIGRFNLLPGGALIPHPTLSDGLREARCGARQSVVEVAIETHRDDTQEQTAARSRGDRIFIDNGQSVADQRRQAVQVVSEIGHEVDLIAPLERSDIDSTETHELLDELGAQHVV